MLSSALAMFTTGCTTAALWGRVDHSPKDVTLLVSPHTQDVLVRYNEDIFTNSFKQSVKSHQYQPRAYWLSAWTNTAKHHSPEFVDVTNSNDWISIPFVTVTKERPPPAPSPPSGSTNQAQNAPVNHPFLSTTLVTNALPEHGYYAISKWPEFELWRNGKKIGGFRFPPRHSEWGLPTFCRVVLTPITITADTVTVVLEYSVKEPWYLIGIGLQFL